MHKINFILFSFLVIFSFSVRADLFAQEEIPALPSGASAEVLEKNVREEAMEDALQGQVVPEISIEEHKKSAPIESIPFYVRDIILKGDLIIPEKDYIPLVEQYEDRDITFNDLQKLMDELERIFRSKGYIAILSLPPQKMETPEIILDVIISKMGKLTVEGLKYSKEKRIRSFWKIKKGEVLLYKEIREAALRMNENPDRTIKPILRAGEEKRTTDIVLKAEEHFPIHAEFTFDNQGVKLTGRERPGFMIRHNNLLGLDDMFLIGTVFGNNFGAMYMYYIVPITDFGTKFVASFSHSQVSPKKEFKAFGINGLSQTYSVGLRQRLIKTDRVSANLSMGFDFKEKRTRILSVTTVWDKMRVLNFGGDFQRKDKFGAWSLNQKVSFGMPNRGDGYPLASRQGEHSFMKYYFSLMRIQKLPWKTRLLWNLTGQLTHDRLLPQEQMFLGGAKSIRGYPESDFGADEAIISRLEYNVPFFIIPEAWRLPFEEKPLRERIHLISFVDWGYGYVFRRSSEERRDHTLFGYGAGFEIKLRNNISARFEWAVRGGDRPITESGRSQFYFRLKTAI